MIECYFREMNSVFPVLHRPTFERSVAEGLHCEEEGFAHILLIVCAIGSRFVDDPRVLADSTSSLSAGWTWFNQVPMVNDMLQPPQLYNIQLHCVRFPFPSHASPLKYGPSLRLCFCTHHPRHMYAGPSLASAFGLHWISVLTGGKHIRMDQSSSCKKSS